MCTCAQRIDSRKTNWAANLDGGGSQIHMIILGIRIQEEMAMGRALIRGENISKF